MFFSKRRPARTIAEKMIKVNHAGENGAVNIYRAQRIAARIRARHFLGPLTVQQSHEEAHRRLFGNWLARHGIRRCMSYHLCGLGGFTLGFVTGVMGANAIAATTFAVENVVLDHLDKQVTYLSAENPSACECVKAILHDEQAHHDMAEDQVDQSGALTRSLIWTVRLCTESVIRFGMR